MSIYPDAVWLCLVKFEVCGRGEGGENPFWKLNKFFQHVQELNPQTNRAPNICLLRTKICQFIQNKSPHFTISFLENVLVVVYCIKYFFSMAPSVLYRGDNKQSNQRDIKNSVKSWWPISVSLPRFLSHTGSPARIHSSVSTFKSTPDFQNPMTDRGTCGSAEGNYRRGAEEEEGGW